MMRKKEERKYFMVVRNCMRREDNEFRENCYKTLSISSFYSLKNSLFLFRSLRNDSISVITIKLIEKWEGNFSLFFFLKNSIKIFKPHAVCFLYFLIYVVEFLKFLHEMPETWCFAFMPCLLTSHSIKWKFIQPLFPLKREEWRKEEKYSKCSLKCILLWWCWRHKWVMIMMNLSAHLYDVFTQKREIWKGIFCACCCCCLASTDLFFCTDYFIILIIISFMIIHNMKQFTHN